MRMSRIGKWLGLGIGCKSFGEDDVWAIQMSTELYRLPLQHHERPTIWYPSQLDPYRCPAEL